MRSFTGLSLSAFILLQIQETVAVACTPNDIYAKVLHASPIKASAFCSQFEHVPKPTKVPAWLSNLHAPLNKISSACSCFIAPTTAPSSTASTSTSTILSSSVSAVPTTTSSGIATSSATTTGATTASAATTTSATTTSSAAGNANTSPPAGAVVVSQSGETGSYATVQEGVDALSVVSTGEQSLFIYPGVYNEQVYIPARAANLTVYGYTVDSTSYASNTVNITYNLALINTTSDDLTATVRVWAKNFKMYNVNILNTFGHTNSNGQNLALSAHVGNQGYYGVGLYGYQDTLLANTGNQLYAKSLILGAIDFIFGQTATAWLDQIDIVTIAAGSVTASGRADDTNPSWYVINNSTVHGVNATVEAKAGINYLGRPWGNSSRVTFQETYLSDVINPAGWSVWSKNGDPRTNDVTYEEYNNYGPGSFPTEGPRANFSTQISSPRLIGDIIGAGYAGEWWVDTSYLS